MIKVYTGFKGFTMTLLLIAGVVLFLSIFFWGITKAIELFLPVLMVMSYLLIVVFVFVFLPATFFKDQRPSLAVYSVWMSNVLGVSTWVMSFLFVVQTFGFLGIFLVFLFPLLAPVALVAAALKGAWHIAVHLSLWITFTYGMRFYSRWLSNLNSPDRKKRDIIDVDIIEVRNA